MTFDFDRLLDALKSALRELQGLIRLFDIRLKAGEFIAAHASDEVGIAHDALQSLGHNGQWLVADGMTEAVIDRLEAVEVQVVHRKACGGCVGVVHGHRHALEKDPAIDKPGQAVVTGQVANALFLAPALGDVGSRARPGACGHSTAVGRGCRRHE